MHERLCALQHLQHVGLITQEVVCPCIGFACADKRCLQAHTATADMRFLLLLIILPCFNQVVQNVVYFNFILKGFSPSKSIAKQAAWVIIELGINGRHREQPI